MPERVKVGMASWQVARDKDILVTYGLGSCVGLGIWDPSAKIAAMAHIMLPDSKLFRFRQGDNSAKFADTALAVMLERLPQMGVVRSRLLAKLVGGANMFMFSGKKILGEEMNIGLRNVLAVKEKLRELGIPLVGEDTGGTSGRTVEYYSETGIMKVRIALSGEREL